METKKLLAPPPPYSGPTEYRQLPGAGRRRKPVSSSSNNKVIWLGGRQRRRQWRVKVSPRVRMMVKAPLKLMWKVKNAYVNFMVKLAGNVGTLNSEKVFGGRRIPKARQVSCDKDYSVDAFEARLLLEIAKAIVASRS